VPYRLERDRDNGDAGHFAVLLIVNMKAFFIFAAFAIVLSVAACGPIMGTGPFGPTTQTVVTVTDKYVDVSGGGKHANSHYMVATDQGIYEIDNGLMLGVWNADELYGRMLKGKAYRITIKGNKVVNAFMQEYPYIVGVSSP